MPRDARPDRAALRRDLRALILEGTPALDGQLTDDTSLIGSALVESSTLVSVALWVEDRVGRALDLAAIDLVAEWDTVTSILDFVERHQGAAARGAPSGRESAARV